MYKFKQSLAAFAGLLALVSVVALLTPRVGLGQGGGQVKPPQDVNVINTPAVSVVNTPDVHVANTVRISDGAKEPFAVRTNMFFGLNSAAIGTILYTVPAGKRLVVTHVGARADVESGQGVLFSISARGLPRLADPVSFPLASTKPAGAVHSFIASEPLEFHLDAGEELSIFATRAPSSGNGEVIFSVTGYLVGVP